MQWLTTTHAIAEAVSLGQHLRLERDVLLDVLSKTAVIAPAMVGKFQKIKANDYSPQFPLRLMSKDMDLVMDAARKSGAELPAASATQSVLASNVSSSGDLDLSAITAFVVLFLAGVARSNAMVEGCPASLARMTPNAAAQACTYELHATTARTIESATFLADTDHG